MLYSYTATTTEGTVQRGIMEGPTNGAIFDILTRQGLSIVSIKESSAAKKSMGGGIVLFGRIKFYEYISFVDRLATMIKVGYALTDAVDVLHKDTTNPIFKEILLQVKFGLEKGQTLSSLLAKHPKHFSSIFISLIKAGESSGTLEKVLDHLSVQLKKDYDLRKKIKSALIYPVFLFILTVIVMLGMFIFIMPRLVKVFAQSEVELPITTKILLAVSKVLSFNIPLTLITAGFLAIFLITLVRSQAGKAILSRIGFHLPVVKKLMRQVALARFARTLSSLLGSGISILEAIDLTADVAGPSRYGQIIRGSKKSLEKGVPLSVYLSREPDLFPNLLLSMISVGEKSGELDNILQKAADFYEVEVDSSLKDLVVFLEPAMLFFIAIAIGFLALAIITPIYSLVGSIG
ncbi:MAG: type II secretion system F family protein [Patescibacteria group bacterium]